MSFFKKIGRSIGGAFKSIPGAISSVFKKAPGIVNQISGGLSKVGDVLGSVADVGSKILSNPLLEAGASALLGPEAGLGMAALGKGLGYVKQGSQIAKTASQITGAKNPMDFISGIQKARDMSTAVGPSFA